ncbi:MAG: hypothetical protein P4L59_13090 [Desulfosporosinus sp.]|nr:hypothetical protein [Desulfosporosinus sp.]
MTKFSKKITAIVGTATLAIGLLALPALAGTTQQQGNGIVGQMQGFMQQTFSQGQHQVLMNSTGMQNLHNSAGMQKAIQTGDVNAMQGLMNSDPTVKSQMGQGNLVKMNQFMSNSSGNMMTNGSGNTNFGSSMMNGSRTSKTGSNMMNF